MGSRHLEQQVRSDRRWIRPGRLKVSVTLLFFLLLISLLPGGGGTAQQNITALRNILDAYYPVKLTFHLLTSSTADIQTITLSYSTNAHTCQSAVSYQQIDFEPSTSVEVAWEYDFTELGILPPGAEISWQWEITDTAGNTLQTEEQTHLITDNRYAWHSLNSGSITLMWYQGTSAFGQNLMTIAVQALERLSEQAGIAPPGQIWISVYPSSYDVREVAIHVSEWVGGVAYPEYQSTIIGIAPDELEWAAMIIPHELAHLVTDALVFNCRGVRIPTWLSEGLAMVAQGDQSTVYNDAVLFALEAGELPPLRTLTRGFSPYANDASRAYGQSSMVVTYMLEQYGPEAMADLLAAIQSGLTADEALNLIYQMETDGLDSAWRISLGFAPQPTRAALNTTPTLVSTLPLWTAIVQPSSTPLPTATSTATPTQTPIPETPQPEIEPTALPTPPSPNTGAVRTILLIFGIGTLVGGLLVASLVIILLRSRRREK
jgi:hypothetical protein